MNFHEKLQNLRKQNNLTQEELAKRLYVSRTAISKWESGRGFPNIDSLKAIASCFNISVDELLSGDELLVLAQKTQLHDLLFGLLDCSTAILLFLPFFAQKGTDKVLGVPLLSLTDISPYLKASFWVVVATTILFGVLTLALQNCHQTFWSRNKHRLSLLLSVMAVCLFILCRQPYAAIFWLMLLLVKAISLIKRR